MQATIQYIIKELEGLYNSREISGITRLLIESVCGWTYTEQVLHQNSRIPEEQFLQLKRYVERVKNFEPVQYVLGETEFFGMRLSVNSSVLIPRPETEELVNWIVRKNKNDQPRILDVGTGSGCIALALKKAIKNASVEAVDVSAEALRVALNNSLANHLEISTALRDVLKWKDYTWSKYHIIVSNPPYVMETEKELMKKNVLRYEPDQALFVPDNNALVFYKRIADLANEHLHPGGELFFEINEQKAQDMEKMLKDRSFEDICVKRDLNGRDRMLYCRKRN